jgi:PAS domain S-box-containing protein
MKYLYYIIEKVNCERKAAYLCLLLVFIIVGSYLGVNYYLPFHITVEAYSSFTSFVILIMALNTYEISGNIPFLFMGIAFGTAGVFNVIHILASNGMGFFAGDTTNLSMAFSLIQRYIIAISILICCRLFNKSYKMITPLTITLGYTILSAAMLSLVFLLDLFPASYIHGYGNTTFKIVNEYIISIIVLRSTVTLYRAKKSIEYNVFLLLQLYSYITVIYNILLTFYTAQHEITNVLAHILRAVSFYCIYRAIVKVGLKTPYKLLFNEINQKNNSLEQKDSELKRTAHQLKRENILRKNMEEGLLRNEACYKLLIQNSRDAIIVYDYKKIIFANGGAATLAGVEDPEGLLGKEITEFLKLDMQQTMKLLLDREDDTRVSASTYETEVISSHGGMVPVEVTNAYIVYENKPAILSLIRDISPHKQIEKMKENVEKDRKLVNETLEWNRLITEFFSNISHELRTPLNVILSALQVLGNTYSAENYEETAEKRNRYIKMMRQNCYRLLKLINNLMDITRIDSGYASAKMYNYNIVSVVEDITSSVAEYIRNKGIELIFDTNVEEKIIACDPDKIERVMLNLISNSVKFTESGGIIKVEVMDKGDIVNISVMDTGIGIPEDKLEVIFERFRQADNKLSRSYEGSGIGLSLVKSLIEMHGGNIDVKSSVGEGSEFIITLPARTVDYPEPPDNGALYQDNKEKISIEFSDI